MSRLSTKARRATRRRRRDERAYVLNGQEAPGRPLYFDMNGRPIGLGTWAVLFESRQRFLATDYLANGYRVSTVWLGLDHSFGFGGPPLIFESGVFRPSRGKLGAMLDCERYPTRKAAREGHRALVEAWRKRPALGVVPEPPEAA